MFASPRYLPPFADVLDYAKFSLSIDIDDVPRLKRVLRAADHASLHAHLLAARPAFEWLKRTEAYDAKRSVPPLDSAATPRNDDGASTRAMPNAPPRPRRSWTSSRSMTAR